MESIDSNEGTTGVGSESDSTSRRGRSVKKVILGFSLVGVITLVSLGIVAYFTLGQLWTNFTSTTISVPLLTNQPAHNRIAFMGNDANLWLVSPNGQDLRQVTEDGKGYHFPTWAPDGNYLAYIGPDNENNRALYVTPTGFFEPTILFNQPDSAPFYLYWAPDSHSITFLTQETKSLAMRMANAKLGNNRVLGEGNPFYWVWSPAGDKLLMHVGGSRSVSDKAHLSILENRDEASRIELNLAPGRFQAPGWSADGKHIFYIAADEGGKEAIYQTDPETLEQTKITELMGYTFMTLSPDDRQIAYLQIEEDDRAPLGTAYLVDADGQNRRRLTDNPVGSMYWSPDGTKLALLSLVVPGNGPTAKAAGLAAPLPQELQFRWLIYDVATKELKILTSFSPTRHFLQTVPYFDQYHRSLTFWSPDSRYFVITKEKSNRNNGTIWVYDVMGEEEPRQVGEGTLAVWSWQ